MNLSYVFEHGDGVLLTTFLILIIMSLASWYVIFWKAWRLRREHVQLAHFGTRQMAVQDWPRLARSIAADGEARFLLQTTEQLRHALEGQDKADRTALLDMHLSQTLDHIRTRLDSGLTILASVGSSAPFIGLFGTVWGVYIALTRVAAEGNASLSVVAGPMGEALVATAVGLFAAIPAVLAYNAFVRTNRVLVQNLRHIAEQLAVSLSKDSAAYATSEPVKRFTGGH